MIFVEASPNIAFIKYWGKQDSTSDLDQNIGVNPSVSMTLNRAKTTLHIEPASGATRHLITINGIDANPTDTQKILNHIKRIEDHFFDTHPKGAGLLNIRSENNFPASAGIASSASSFAALTIGICAAVIGKTATRNLLQSNPQRLSQLARRGSGSAARSICGGYMRWDTTHAESLNIDWPLRDTIVMLSSQAKSVSSSEGHRRALTSPHFETRQLQVPSRTQKVIAAMKQQDLATLGPLLEAEALEMHLIAETSEPATHYLSVETKNLVRAIQAMPHRNFYFTIDAGPNLHLISEVSIVDQIQALLKATGIAAQIWEDGLGTGPTLE